MFGLQETDEFLIEKAREGNSAALGKLYDRYFQQIYRFCYWQTNQSQDAQDLTQQVFIEMVEHIQNFKGDGQFKNWLYTIAKRTVAAWIRKKYELPTVALFEQIFSEDEDWLHEKANNSLQKKVKKLLQLLDEKYQHVLTLRYLKNYSVAETAKELNLTESNVKVMTKRALEKIAKLATEQSKL